MKTLVTACLLTLGLAACDSERVVDRNVTVPAENEVIVEENEAREPAPEGDERPR